MNKASKRLIIAVSLMLAAPALARPTGIGTDMHPRDKFTHPPAAAGFAPESFAEFTSAGFENSALSDIGKSFFGPPEDPAMAGSDSQNTPRPLPAVPGAAFLAFTGFLCVSFVRDRRLWLAAAVSLLWAGQLGICALPQAALRTAQRAAARRHSSYKLTKERCMLTDTRTCSDTEETAYIGLLRKLSGIPDSAGLLKDTGETDNTTYQTAQPAATFNAGRYFQSAYQHLAETARRFIHFTAAFSFELIPRSPPAPQLNPDF